VIEYVSVWAGRSASVAVTVNTAVVFSGTLAVFGDVNTGLLLLTCTLGDLHIDQRIALGKKPALGDVW
jgi:hypothetical protein